MAQVALALVPFKQAVASAARPPATRAEKLESYNWTTLELYTGLTLPSTKPGARFVKFIKWKPRPTAT